MGELRLGKDGVAVFLVTIDSVHYEVTGVAAHGSWGSEWTHVAGTFDGKVLRIHIAGEVVNELVVPAGQRSSFNGPICFGMNPEWRDRITCCLLHTARITPAIRDRPALLPSPVH